MADRGRLSVFFAVAAAVVVAAGAAGAYTGDLVMYAMCRFGGEKMARRLRWLRDEEHLTGVPDVGGHH